MVSPIPGLPRDGAAPRGFSIILGALHCPGSSPFSPAAAAEALRPPGFPPTRCPGTLHHVPPPPSPPQPRTPGDVQPAALPAGFGGVTAGPLASRD